MILFLLLTAVVILDFLLSGCIWLPLLTALVTTDLLLAMHALAQNIYSNNRISQNHPSQFRSYE